MSHGDNVKLACARTEHFSVLERFLKALRRDDPMPSHPFVDGSTAGTALRQLLSEESLGRVWLIRHGETSVGYVALTFVFSIEFGGRCAFVDEFFIDAGYRGRGIGKEALRQVCEIEAPALGVRALFLEVSETNIAAAGLYRAMGFTRRDYGLMTKWVLKQ